MASSEWGATIQPRKCELDSSSVLNHPWIARTRSALTRAEKRGPGDDGLWGFLYLYGFDADDGLLAPDLVGGAARCNADLLGEILAATAAIQGARDRIAHGL